MRCQTAFFIGVVFLGLAVFAETQQAGSIRGTVYDKETDTPLAAAQVLIAETAAKTTASDEGSFVFGQVPPGKYTLVFSKDGYTRQVSPDVTVSEGEMKDVNASLTGEYTDMDEFVVQKLETGGGTEEGLLNMRKENPALMGSVSSELMSRAGASDAASALKLVSGASVQEGKYAVVRGLPDRYVSSQMNGVRLPTADLDKRAVQLDQFPSAMIESIQISKTFTPDQQGDASGGAVNIVLKGVPDENILNFKIGAEYNSQTPSDGKFLTYKGGGVDFTGLDGGREMQTPGTNWSGAVGVSRGDAPPAYNWTLTAGGKKEVLDGLKIGALGNFYYKQTSSFYDNGVNDSYSATGLNQPLAPVTGNINSSPVYTSLFDMTKASQEVQWGGLGAIGAETENNAVKLMYMRTQSTKDTAILAEDTRGKAYFLKHPLDPDKPDDPLVAPYWRSEALEYVERKTDTLQLSGNHTLASVPETGIPGYFVLLPPEVDWTVAKSMSGLDSPDKRLFASYWLPEQISPGYPQWGIPPTTNPATYYRKIPPENGNLGNVQRIWKEVTEESQQYFVNGKLPFEQWSGDKGYVKFGTFNDEVTRDFKQDSFSNFGDTGPDHFEGSWDEYWSSVFPYEGHLITPSDVDVNYKGKQNISAWYWMADVPLCSFFKVVGGVRYEKTDLQTVNDPKPNARYISINKDTGLPESIWLGSTGGPGVDPHAADVSLQTNNILPSIGFEFKPVKSLSLRASYSETVARPTFKEITPVQQMEYVGAPIFIGNKDLQMSTLKNYDLRADYTPVEGSLLSASWFHKDIINPIEYQQISGGYTMPLNYPEGKLTGIELEGRQQLGRFWDVLDGLSVGANATFIKSEVTLPENQAENFPDWAPMKTRDMVNTPSYLYNLNTMYDIKKTGTQLGLFYTVQGDTLVAGAAPSDYVPNVYAKEYGTLNFNISQKLSKHLKLTFQAKNLLNPEIQEVYRSDYVKGETVKTSYTKGIEYSLSLGGEF